MQVVLQNAVIPARRFSATLAFYRDVLGLDVLHSGAQFCFLRAGHANIAVHAAADEGELVPTGHGIYMDFLVDDLAAMRARFEGAGVQIRKEWRDHNGDFLLVADPEGNLLEVYQAVPAN